MKKKRFLAYERPDLLKEWDYNNNKGLDPNTITVGSGKFINWACPNGHKFTARIPERIRGDNCPFCSGRKVVANYNDLATTHPDIAAEWNYSKNKPITPKDISYGMNKTKYGWICSKCGNEWDAAPLTRTRGSGCPVCGKEKQKKSRIKTMLRDGKNSLGIVRPDLVSEWHPTENGNKKPSSFTLNSNEKIVWLCSKCQNVWTDSINHRNNGRGCPVCNEKNTSYSEQIVFYYVKKYFPSAINRDKSNGFELDVYIPEKKIAIEYDGFYYHGKNKNGMSDEKKDKLCSEKGIRLIRVREKGLVGTKRAINILRKGTNYNDLEICIVGLLKLLGTKSIQRPNIKNDMTEINKQYNETFKKNSLLALYPNVAERWHPIKNGNLKPDQVTAHSGNKVWWMCPEGHEYYQKISAATNGHGCDKCARKKVGEKNKKRGLVVGENDLTTQYPLISKQWDYNKNNDKPQEYLAHSNIKKYWICDICGESYISTINNRVQGKAHKKCQIKQAAIKRSKSVKCVDTGKVFPTLEEAAKWAGVTKGAISLCANRKTKTAAGYHWEYLKDK